MSRISVIIPAYNHADYIDQAVQSVLSQTCQDFELLISDDCSTDGTAEKLAAYEGDPRVTVFLQKEHLGAVEQIHFLVDHAQGEFTALLNSDDYWMPDKLEKQLACMELHPEIDVCFTQALMVDEQGVPLEAAAEPLTDIFKQPNRYKEEWFRHFWISGNCLCHPSILARKSVYCSAFRMNPSLRQLPDWDLWMRLMQEHEIHILLEPLVCHRRIASTNTSADTLANTDRLLLELAWVMRKTLINMDDDLLVRTFRLDFLQKKDAYDEEDLLCERFFLMHKAGENNPTMRVAALMYYMEQSVRSSFTRRMKECYGFDDLRFFELSASWRDGKLPEPPPPPPPPPPLPSPLWRRCLRKIRRLLIGKRPGKEAPGAHE